jgi:hypothetical protein
MSPEWIQVRMRRATYARLREFGARTLKLVDTGRVEAEPHSKGELSADALVAILLDRDARHQERTKKARGNRK